MAQTNEILISAVKAERIKIAMENYFQAHCELHDAWLDLGADGEILNEAYPFSICFNDLSLKVRTWQSIVDAKISTTSLKH